MAHHRKALIYINENILMDILITYAFRSYYQDVRYYVIYDFEYNHTTGCHPYVKLMESVNFQILMQFRIKLIYFKMVLLENSSYLQTQNLHNGTI